MRTRTAQTAQRRLPLDRTPLSRERVLETGLALADEGGLEALSMRNLAHNLDVAPMALYYHFANKAEVVDGLIDLVFGEVDVPAGGGDWKTEMRQRAVSLRDALLRHRWAIGLMESRRNPGPANLRHHDAVIGSLRAAGFDMAMAAHAYSALDAYIYGFALTKMNLPFESGSSAGVVEVAETMLAPFAEGSYPNLVAFITEHAMQPDYDFGAEFEYGLELLLDGLQRTAADLRPPIP